MKILIIDGQGGKMGKGIIEQLLKYEPDAQLWAIGTNGIATATMLKAGAAFAATGENPVIVNCRDADIIIGPIGIVIADALFGEVTPAMAVAVGQSRAEKILLPVNKCKNNVVGVSQQNFTELVNAAVKMILETMGRV